MAATHMQTMLLVVVSNWHNSKHNAAVFFSIVNAFDAASKCFGFGF